MEPNRNQIHVINEPRSAFPLPTILITLEAFQKIKCYIDICEYEINGFGIVEREEDIFTISDVFILKQSTQDNGVHVETDPEALNSYIYELVSNDGDASKIKFQWHSHVNWRAIFSKEDIDTISNYMNDFMISLVINKKGDCSCRLDIFEPIHLSLEIPIFVKIPNQSENLFEQCHKDIKQYVQVESVPGFKSIKIETKTPQEFSYVNIQDLI